MKAAEQITQYGVRSVSEILLLTALGIPEQAASDLMGNGTLAAIAKMTTREIEAVKGIGKAGAAAIVAAFEIGKRRQVETATQKNVCSSSLDAYELIHSGMRDLTQEEFWIILLDRRNHPIKVEVIHKGGMSSMVVDPKVVFQKALEYKASYIIMAHNHPSGTPSPSMEDIRLTEKMVSAGKLIDLKVIDHLVIGDGAYYSFADEGKI